MVAEALPKPASIWSRRRLQEVWRHSSRKRRLLKGQWALGARAPAGSRERGPRHPQQVETEAQAQAREKLDRHLQRSQRARARAKEREERTKERATQSTKPGCSCATVGISAAVRAASYRREAHALQAELTNAPRAGRTSTRQGSARRLDWAEKKILGPRRRRPQVR